MFLHRREHIEDAPTRREVATPFDEVHLAVTGLDQPSTEVVEIGLVTGAQHDGFKVPKPLHDRLQQRAYRRNEHPNGAAGRVGRVRMGEPTQHREASTDGV